MRFRGCGSPEVIGDAVKRAWITEVVDGEGQKRDGLRKKEDDALQGAVKDLIASLGLAELLCSPHGGAVRTSAAIEPRSRLASLAVQQTCRGPFSSVSTLLIARVGAFFRIFRDLQDCHTFAPLQC